MGMKKLISKVYKTLEEQFYNAHMKFLNAKYSRQQSGKF